MSVVISHPTGNEFARAAVLSLANSNNLAAFITSVAFFEGNPILKRHSGLFGEARRRMYDSRLQPFTHTFPFKEIGRMFASKMHWNGLTRHETGPFSVDAVYRNIDRQTAGFLEKEKKRKNISTVYAYEDGALNCFEAAKTLGITCAYDLPIGYWRAMRDLLQKTKVDKPEWASTLTGFRDSEAKLQRKDREIALADKIVVASSFTKSTLQNYYQGALPPITVIPYGFPVPVASREYNAGDKPLKLLFVGGLSQRKGIAEVFEAANHLRGKVELTVVGRKSVSNCNVLNENLSKHRYIEGLPHGKILELMRSQDILLFPSHFEGFGLVITEAMSQGTPVITTDRTAGPDIITHGENGWLVEAGNTQSLLSQIEEILVQRKNVATVGMAALDAAHGWSWNDYGREIVNFLVK